MELNDLLLERFNDIKFLTIVGHPESPIKHLDLTVDTLSDKEKENMLAHIVEECEKSGVAVVQSKKVPADLTHKQKTIRKMFNCI